MTEKLYYKDSYISEFTARVTECRAVEGGFDVTLDRTAFFPEEGGQSSDHGYIGSARVLDVYERDGDVHHITDVVPEGTEVACRLDFDERLEKMQCHSAEHILCGIIHRLYGLENVGFHLGEDEVVFDVSGVLSSEELERVEHLANEAVFANLEVTAFFPNEEELASIEYRSKLELTENIRLVMIGDVDVCACCAPHVRSTGEIGLIKILEFMKHRGGMRIRMVAGGRALTDYNIKYSNIKRISALLSAPQHQTAEILEKYMAEAEGLRAELKHCRIAVAEERGRAFACCEGNAVVYHRGFSVEELRAFSNAARPHVGGILVALSEREQGYQYVICSESVDLSRLSKRFNADLAGRGGGKPNMITGSFGSELSTIEDYFKNQKYNV